MLKREQRRLERLYQHLLSAQKYILEERILVCVRARAATTTLHFTNPQGEICYSVDKEYGSPLAELHTAVSDLKAMLDL